MPKTGPNCLKRQLLMEPRQIHTLRFILEAYEGIAVLTTLDSKLGLVELSIAPGCESDVLSILKAEQEQLKTRPVQFCYAPVKDAVDGLTSFHESTAAPKALETNK